MSELKFTVSTDTEHTLVLDSQLVYANWRTSAAYGGQRARFEIGTAFVGNGAKIKIKGQSEFGESLGKIKDVITNNKYVGEFEIPIDIEIGDEVYFEVKLPKNGLQGESSRIPAFPPVEVSNMKWSAKEARRGDVLTLTADIKGVQPGTEVPVTIYEYDVDGAHEKITDIPAIVKNKKIEVMWEYEYHDSTTVIPSEDEMQPYRRKYQHPEYFFTVRIGGEEYGKQQETGLLRFKDGFNFQLTDDDGNPVPDQEYILYLADGQERKGTLDENGEAFEKDLPPGEVLIEFPDDEDDDVDR